LDDTPEEIPVANENRRGEKTVVDLDGATPPPLDQSRMQTERRAATDRLLARLKALEGAQGAQTPRTYARRYVREQESLILGLLNAGVATDEILADLALTLPSIPTADFRQAIAQLRDRRRKQVGPSATATTRLSASTPALGSPGGEAAARPVNSAPSAADRRPEESEEDYRLRRALEGPADQSQQFIGEP
jgi:hypothetical protein